MLLPIFLIIFQLQCKIVQVHVVSRHCDRTGTSNLIFPNYPVDIQKKLNQTTGKLTLLGLKECYELGVNLRQRYLSPTSPHFISGINPIYNSPDYKFESTSVQRSMRSLEAVGIGLFPPGTGNSLDVPPFTPPLPHGIQPIPIHTIDKIHDRFLLGMEIDKCKTVWDNYDEFFTTEIGKKILEDSKPIIDEVEHVTGLTDITFRSIYKVHDHMNVLKSHNALPPALEGLFKKITNITDLSFTIVFGRQVVENLGAGELVSKILSNMKLYSETNAKRRSVTPSPEFSTPNIISMNDVLHDKDNHRREIEGSDIPDRGYYLYHHYSSHDSTLGCVLSALRLNVDYPALGSNIKYGSAIIFELHQDDLTRAYSVKIIFRRGWDGDFEYFRLVSLAEKGCVEDCPLSTFEELAKEDAIPKNWCGSCGNQQTDVCLSERILLLEQVRYEDTNTITALAVVSGVFLVFSVVFAIAILILCISKFGKCEFLKRGKEKKKSKGSYDGLMDENDDDIVLDEEGREIVEVGSEGTNTTGLTTTTDVAVRDDMAEEDDGEEEHDLDEDDGEKEMEDMEQMASRMRAGLLD